MLIEQCELEDFLDVIVEITNLKKVTNFTYHYSVQNASTMKPQGQCKIIFKPPPNNFNLCKYSIPEVQPPVKGTYQLRDTGDDTVRISLYLKLGELEPLDFEYCDVYIPFPNRPQIHKVNLTPTTGKMLLSTNKQTIVWRLGTKFKAKGLDVSIVGTVHFKSKEETFRKTDPFFVGENTFVSV